MRVKDYLVYDVYYCGFLAYVGSGYKDRPEHVRSGKSHNKSLNEISVRSKVLGEPDVDVVVHKYFDNKQDAMTYEKKRIKSKNPLFNRTFCSGKLVKILDSKSKQKLAQVDKRLLDQIERLEWLGLETKTNPNLIFTPFGFRFTPKGVSFATECFDLVSYSMFGYCTFLDDLCTSFTNHDNEIVLRIRPEKILELNSCLGEDVFSNSFDVKRDKIKPMIEYEDYDVNYNGASISKACYKYIEENVVLARRLNTYKGIDVVTCMRVVDENTYQVFCLNNGQIIYETNDSSLAIEVHRRMDLRFYKFTTYSDTIELSIDFSLEGCIDLNK